MEINPIDSIQPEVKYYPKKEMDPPTEPKHDMVELSYYVEIAKASPVSRDALEALLMIDVGATCCLLLKETYLS